MLHLPSPHRCPACGGPHQEQPPALSAERLRPYFATYTPSKFPRALARITVAATGTTGTSTVDGTSGAGKVLYGGSVRQATLGTPSVQDTAVFSIGSDTITVLRAGEIHILASFTVAIGYSEQVYFEIRKNGSALPAVLPNPQPDYLVAQQYDGVVAANDALTFFWRLSMGGLDKAFGNSRFDVLFIPTPTYPQ